MCVRTGISITNIRIQQAQEVTFSDQQLLVNYGNNRRFYFEYRNSLREKLIEHWNFNCHCDFYEIWNKKEKVI